MPVIDFSQNEGRFPFLSQELLCAMVFPNDPGRREQARATLVLNALASSLPPGEIVSIPAHLLRTGLSGEGLQTLRKTMAAIAQEKGWIAGSILLQLIDAKALGARPLLGRTRLDHVGNHATRAGERFTLGETKVRNAWREYRGVAHYWAASLWLAERTEHGINDFLNDLGVLNEHGEPETQQRLDQLRERFWIADWEQRMASEQGVAEVVAVAMSLLDQALTIQTADANGPEPVVDRAEAWVPPEDFPVPTRRS